MRFKSKLVVEVPLHDNGKRKLIEPLIHELVIVPRGFETDYASIPRAFWVILAPTGKHTYAAVVHDYLYASGLKTKEEFSGCTGMITGHVYTAEEIKQIREIAKDVYQDAKYVKEDMGK
jgi:hypothetical protein